MPFEAASDHPALPPEDPRALPARRPRSRGVMALLGILAVGVGLVVAGGYGRPTVLFFVGGLILILSADALARRLRRGGREGQVVAVLGTFLMTVGVAKWSATISPDAACQRAFGVAVPLGVKVTDTKRRFYDGTIILIRLNTDEKGLAQLCAARQFQVGGESWDRYREGYSNWETLWRSLFALAPIADRSWSTPPAMSQPRIMSWESKPPGESLREHTTVAWDAANGEGYVSYFQD